MSYHNRTAALFAPPGGRHLSKKTNEVPSRHGLALSSAAGGTLDRRFCNLYRTGELCPLLRPNSNLVNVFLLCWPMLKRFLVLPRNEVYRSLCF
jgi:hypothetical protein